MNDETIREQAEAEAVETDGETAVDNQAPEPAALSLEEELAAARAEAAKNLDGWMRVQAEFVNARKRFEKQQMEAYTNAASEAVKRLLPVIDDFDRAMASVPEAVAADGWFEGITLVHRKLNGILDSFNVEVITAVGQPFDPMLHEAIMQEESDEFASGVVTRELQKGYKLGERVMRPALVYVAA